MDGKTAECITDAILRTLKEDGLDLKNMVGLGTDGASTLTGPISGVITRLQDHHDELVLIKCVCHSLHNAAKYAFAKLPSHLESLIKEVYGYFCQSSCRQDRYREV